MSQSWQLKFYRQTNGNEPVKEFLQQLTKAEVKQISARLKRLQELGLMLMVERADILEKIEDNLYSLRLANTQHNPRILLCVLKKSNSIYLLHGFKKKDRKIPQRHLNIARQRRNQILGEEIDNDTT